MWRPRGLPMLLTLASPVFFADGISYYAMSAHLLANAVFALLLMEPTPRRAFLAGIVGSVALTLHNPVPHMLFAAPWIIWLLAKRRPATRRTPAVCRLFAALRAAGSGMVRFLQSHRARRHGRGLWHPRHCRERGQDPRHRATADGQRVAGATHRRRENSGHGRYRDLRCWQSSALGNGVVIPGARC